MLIEFMMRNYKDSTILVVDDDDDLRDVIYSIFSMEGFNTLSANSGNQAWSIINQNKVDLVVSDIRMPDGDGLYLLNKIRAKDPTNPIVIFVTGYADISEKEILARGAIKILRKPFDQVLLLETVKEALS
jgi:DNA-binding NtrC family response regulator